jgi:heptosyltransferase-3
VEKNLDALRRIGIFPEERERDLLLHIPENALSKVKSLVPENFVLIHPASRWKFKCLPTETMAQVIKGLKKQGIEVVLTSGPDSVEMLMVDEIVQKADETVINLAGKLSLKELSALISLSSCLICVDSVALHIASALKTPVIVAFGPTSEINWGPWMHPMSKVITKNVSCRPCYMDGCGGSKKSDCLYSLSAQNILDACHSLLKFSVLR